MTQSGSKLLGSILAETRLELERTGNLLAFPHHWQFPAITEKAAYEAIVPLAQSLKFEFLAIPWATIIDGIRSNAPATWTLLRILNGLAAEEPKPGVRRATVAQHIHADEYIEFFVACGITDLFWSHARVDTTEIQGVRIHPFPLFPAQTPDGPNPLDDIHRKRKYLANFIGAYNPRVYLTNVRERIFDDAGKEDDLLIIKREAWHFNRVVYSEQMKGVSPDAALISQEQQQKEEYLDAIRESTFTLCPSGSGPNSIRIGEALSLASIPVILTRDLALPGEQSLWEEACILEADCVEGYERAVDRMRAMSAQEVRNMQVSTQALLDATGPQAWGALIAETMLS